MPYENNTQLPDSVKKHLPKHAQDIYREAFNHALDEYKEEIRAHKVAWAAVKNKYRKNEETGFWDEK